MIFFHKKNAHEGRFVCYKYNSNFIQYWNSNFLVLLVRNKIDIKNTNQKLINELEKFELIEIS